MAVHPRQRGAPGEALDDTWVKVGVYAAAPAIVARTTRQAKEMARPSLLTSELCRGLPTEPGVVDLECIGGIRA